MRIQRTHDGGTVMTFPKEENKVVFSILRALYTAFKLAFIKEAMTDVEEALKPPLLPFINYFHWCVKCGRDIDERSPDTLRIEQNGDVKWQCRKCKPLKQNRPN